MSRLPITNEEKSDFFINHRFDIASRMKPGVWPDFAFQCDHSINWLKWDLACTRYNRLEYQGLPKRVCHGTASPIEAEMLKGFLAHLLSDKITKTFEELL